MPNQINFVQQRIHRIFFTLPNQVSCIRVYAIINTISHHFLLSLPIPLDKFTQHNNTEDKQTHYSVGTAEHMESHNPMRINVKDEIPITDTHLVALPNHTIAIASTTIDRCD